MINDKLSHFFGVTPEDATEEQYYKAVAMIVRDDLAAKTANFAILQTARIPKRFIIFAWNSLWGVRLKTIFITLILPMFSIRL